MNGVNPSGYQNLGGYGVPVTDGGVHSALGANGGSSIDSAARIALLFIQRANKTWSSALNEAETNAQQTPQGDGPGGQGVGGAQGGQGGQGGAPDNVSMAKLSAAQQNQTAVVTMGSSMIDRAGEIAKKGAEL